MLVSFHLGKDSISSISESERFKTAVAQRRPVPPVLEVFKFLEHGDRFSVIRSKFLIDQSCVFKA